MSPRIGLSLLGEGDTNAIMRVASQAEALEFDALYVSDAPMPSLRHPVRFRVSFDPIPLLGALAIHTSRVKLVTSVLLLPFREPVLTAKALASAHALSGHRVVVGVGSGWRKSEMAIFNVDPSQRGRILDANLEVLDAYFAGRTSYEGTVTWDGAWVGPVCDPPPEIWIGGGSKAAVNRAARRRAVWHPVAYAERAIMPGLEDLVAEYFGQGGVGFVPRVAIAPEADSQSANLCGREEVLRGLAHLVELGATELSLIMGHDNDEIARTAEWFGAEVRPALVG